MKRLIVTALLLLIASTAWAQSPDQLHPVGDCGFLSAPPPGGVNKVIHGGRQYCEGGTGVEGYCSISEDTPTDFPWIGDITCVVTPRGTEFCVAEMLCPDVADMDGNGVVNEYIRERVVMRSPRTGEFVVHKGWIEARSDSPWPNGSTVLLRVCPGW